MKCALVVTHDRLRVCLQTPEASLAVAESQIALSLYDIALEDGPHIPGHLSIFSLRLLFCLRDKHLNLINDQLRAYAGVSALEQLLMNYLRYVLAADIPRPCAFTFLG